MRNGVDMNGHITCDELIKVIQKAGRNKATGYDDIPTDVLKK